MTGPMRNFWCVGYDGEEAVASTAVLTDCHLDAAEAMAENLLTGSDGEWPGGMIAVTDQTSEVSKFFVVSVTIGDLDDDGEADVVLHVEEVEG